MTKQQQFLAVALVAWVAYIMGKKAASTTKAVATASASPALVEPWLP